MRVVMALITSTSSVGRSCGWCARVTQPDMDACAAEEDHLLKEGSEGRGGGLEQLGAHAATVAVAVWSAMCRSVACNASAAALRTRTSPARSESMIDSSLASAGDSRLACTAAGCSGWSA